MVKKVLVINGPNLNLLGKREPSTYGYETLQDIEQECVKRGQALGLEVSCVQDNSEGALIDHIHTARETCDAIVINPAGYTHTSVAVRDALISTDLPIIEVHISNIHKREEFRHFSYVSGIAVGTISGLGTQGYYLALEAVAHQLNK